MNAALRNRLSKCRRPVILLEGTRKLPASALPALSAMARRLFAEFPRAVFRSGNAEGADAVFADAIAQLDPSRLQLVLPHSGMGRKRRPAGAACFSLDDVPKAELESLAKVTRLAGRDAGRLADYYLRGPEARKSAAGSKAAYLLRDSLKIAGSKTLGLAPANLGIFWVNPADPRGGGTGHTIRVCEVRSVPFLSQDDWAAPSISADSIS